MENSLENAEIRENSWLRKKILVFIVCLLVSTLFWFLVVLSRDYTEVLSIPVRYVNLPTDKVVVNTLPSTISLEIKSFGFNLLRLKFLGFDDPVTIDAKQLMRSKGGQREFVVTNARIDRFSSQFSTNVQLIRIIPDTIFFEFDRRLGKELPVVVIYDLSFENQYSLSGSVNISPRTIYVNGPQRILDTMTFIKTDPIKLYNLNKTETVTIRLDKKYSIPGMSFKPPAVNIKIPVEKFTETSIEVPVEPINVPPGYNLKTYPEKLNVTYLVSLSNFEKVKPELFRIVVDFEKADKKGSTRLKPMVMVSPDFVKNIKFSPEKVEYILIKK